MTDGILTKEQWEHSWGGKAIDIGTGGGGWHRTLRTR
jgi:hypothetical protein